MIIGLTGTIGSGKSTVSSRLIGRGARVLDADAFSKKAVEPESHCLREIERVFGKEMINFDGSLNRGALAAVIFANKQKREMLNGIIHPFVLNEFERTTSEQKQTDKSRLIVWDVPLLIEVGWQKKTDFVWVVNANEDIRLARILKRDNCTVEQARRRIAAQMADDMKIACADELIDNSGSIEELYARVDALYNKYTKI